MKLKTWWIPMLDLHTHRIDSRWAELRT